MGRHGADRPDWFGDEQDTAEILQVPDVRDNQDFANGYEYSTEYVPRSHTGVDYSPSRRDVRHHTHKKPRRVTEQTLAILFGIAIGFFICGVIYLYVGNTTGDDGFRTAALIFNGAGIAVSGLTAIGIAAVHIIRTRREQ